MGVSVRSTIHHETAEQEGSNLQLEDFQIISQALFARSTLSNTHFHYSLQHHSITIIMDTGEMQTHSPNLSPRRRALYMSVGSFNFPLPPSMKQPVQPKQNPFPSRPDFSAFSWTQPSVEAPVHAIIVPISPRTVRPPRIVDAA